MKCVQADGKIRSLIGYAAHFLPPSEYLAEIELFHCNTPVSSLKVSIWCILKYVLLIRRSKVAGASQDCVPHIFISYSQEDRDFCLQLVQGLRRAFSDEDAVWYEVDSKVAWATVVKELTTRPIFIVIL